MNSVAVTRPQRSTTARRCTACGGLECLCRPRFFAGQLLTEEDLNRLDHYIVAKHKLHNRYLHGWGVVCGLDVQCDGCDSGSVIVRQGYALSPCGEDVVVCADQRVNVCDLINECRTVTQPDCSRPGVDGGCDEPVQQWILAICYAESSSRGVAPLRSAGCGCGGTTSGGCACGGGGKSGGCGCGGGGAKSGGCGCGGGGGGHSHGASSSGGCGCGGSKGTVATTSASRGASLMQCENTVTCETFSFRVYKAPKARDRKTSQGAMVDSFMACLLELQDALPPVKPTGTTQQELHEWCCEMHDALADWYFANSGYGCETARRVAAIACPQPGDPGFNDAIGRAAQEFALAILDIIMACLCKAMMPQCPVAPADGCVPLAMVTVRTDDGCSVQSICNWTTERQYVLTFPTMDYWLSVLPFGRLLREAIERLCCRPMLRPKRDFVPDSDAQPAPVAGIGGVGAIGVGAIGSATADAAGNTTGGAWRTAAASVRGDDYTANAPADNFRASAATTAASRDFMSLAFQALLTREKSDSAETLVRGLMGDRDEKGEPVWSKTESDNALHRFVLDQMAKPMFRTLVGEQGLSAIGGLAGGLLGDVAAGVMRGPRSSAPADDVLESLQRTVARQQEQIDELLRQRPRGRNK
ncbi:MAG: hypothetical protein IT355_06120 [Gemmatimonadaceae bacterium]|nr:hypothetical protein [Gemmatimonadaceae bacterium]